MTDERPTVICHFRNEEGYLPFWLRHHKRLFGHGILIDYHSTDRSREIIAESVPNWEVRISRNAMFHSTSIDDEVMDIEREISGWKMCLNVTEFVIHHDLREYLVQLAMVRPGATGVVTTGFIMQDSLEQVGMPLNANRELWEQRHHGCPEPDAANGNLFLRRRLLHKSRDGQYNPGRHSNGVTDRADPPLYLFWYGWCPLEFKKRRNRDTTPMVPAEDLRKGWGTHHVLTDAQIDAAWRSCYLPRCRDLLGGEWPGLDAAVGGLRQWLSDWPDASKPTADS